MKDDGSGRKIAAHAIIGRLMSQITGAGFASGAIGAGLNEALIKALDGKDPGTAQIISAIIGAAAAKVAGGNALAGASAAASGTKWNKYEKLPRIKEQLEHLPEQEIYQSLRDGDYILLYDFEENRYSVCIAVNNKGEAWDIPLGDHGYKVKIPESGYVPYTVYDGNVTGAQQDDMFRDRKYIGKLIPATGESVPLKEQKDQTNSFKEFAAVAHEGLDLAGYVPGFGSAAGAAETVLYLAEGNYSTAILSTATIIPGAKYIKAAKKLADVPGVSRLIRTEKNVPVRLPAGKPASSSIPLEDLGRIKPGSKDIYMPDGKSLRPNIQYKAGEFEYLYKTDEAGRLSQFKTDNLQLTERDKRLRHNPNTPGKQEGDQAAHLAADRFGGSPELANLVSQSSHVNLSTYKKLENKWAKAIKEGKNVQVEVTVIYEGASTRPSTFVVTHTIEGSLPVKTTILNK